MADRRRPRPSDAGGGTLARFLVVGTLGAGVNLGSLALLLDLGVGKFLASPAAIELSIVSNFLLHQYWTFAGRGRREVVWARALRFKTVALLALAASYATFVALSWVWPALPPHLAQAAAILPGTAVNYLGNSRWTFPGVCHGVAGRDPA